MRKVEGRAVLRGDYIFGDEDWVRVNAVIDTEVPVRLESGKKIKVPGVELHCSGFMKVVTARECVVIRD